MGQVMPSGHWAEQATRTVPVARLRGFRPVGSVLNRNFFSIYLGLNSNSIFANLYLKVHLGP
jgi:hypothetical protein